MYFVLGNVAEPVDDKMLTAKGLQIHGIMQ
jgi:hypothetical protein